MSDKVLIATVTSLGQPQDGQKHRSSGNFSTEDVPKGYDKFEWEVSNTAQPGSVSFDVKRDKSVAIDPTEYSDLKNGSVTSVKEHRKMYIANPKGSSGGDFLVTVYATK